MCKLVMLLCCLICVSGADGVSVSVMEGDSVTLHTDVETNQQENIKWYFNNTLIARINGNLSDTCTDVQCNEGTERFRDRLQLDNQTGSLTIMNINTTHSEKYTLQVIRGSNNETIFNVTVIDVPAAGMKRKAVTEGESVTLDTPEEKKTNDVMAWFFNDILIAEITGDQSKICTDDQCDERFRDRLKLDNQTGSLIITNIRSTDSGLYNLKIKSSRNRYSTTSIKSFTVSVTDSGPSSTAVAGICAAVAVVLLVVAAVGVIYYHRRSSIKGEYHLHIV
uniref:Immunoglobulin domain-containing protein n=1 Tax=Sinocyclocheilus anshuiensis TaxID=1608454 RepID=A0A671SED1_9TELE